ncbi:2,3-bisphosphoglycerate-dependent phosphoglycerate mutase [Chlamydiales bacterium SCGC AB-751-O23]|jgi:2,3-bisphosphoglycerate-dependent phosphoglycerate mutase|nr:2,3-bisphosphoglycerate-dependent phosphoglycerate mutase [Chlamydiales bacterium SCGC AB-751-O23]
MSSLILLRHGQSMWNQANLFTGWVDIPLSEKGIKEALEAGECIKGIPIDLIYVSSLIRSQMTAMIAMSKHSSGKVPIIQHPDDEKMSAWGRVSPKVYEEDALKVVVSWQLNERMYGDLQGLNKEQTRQEFGKEQVHIWRRSYDTPPPNGESLEMTALRSIPYFEDFIVPELSKGRNILVSAHGNSLRSILMHIDGLSKEEVVELEIPTGKPLIYSFEKGEFFKKDD